MTSEDFEEEGKNFKFISKQVIQKKILHSLLLKIGVEFPSMSHFLRDHRIQIGKSDSLNLGLRPLLNAIGLNL